MEWSLAAKALALMRLSRVGHKSRTERLQNHRTLAATFASFHKESDERRLELGDLLPGCEALVTKARDAGLKVLALDEKSYPDVLRKTGVSPPLVLFVQGELPSQLLKPDLARVASVAVVGTRRATPGGLDEAVGLGRALAAAGVVVVSGLALGIDAAAHRGALMAAAAGEAAPTVAVLGGAHDRLHPQPHARLVEKIVATGGAVISEYPPGVRPNRGSFLARNRIIAWLSRAVVVIEAGMRSGALSTAGYANEAGLPVLAVPANPLDRRRAGNLKLIQEGATPLIDLGDMAGALTSLEPEQSFLRSQVSPGYFGWSSAGTGGGLSIPPARRPSGGPRANGLSPVQVTDAVRDVATGDLELGVMAALHEHGEVSFDGLLSVLSRTASPHVPSAAQLAGALVRLEVGGAVRRGEDGRFTATGALTASDLVGTT